jgi:hypothetical protein
MYRPFNRTKLKGIPCERIKDGRIGLKRRGRREGSVGGLDDV